MDEPEIVSADLTRVIEALIARQTALEVEVTTIGRRADALEQRTAALESVCTLQQVGLEKLAVLLDAHQRIFEAQSGYQPPAPGKSSRN